MSSSGGKFVKWGISDAKLDMPDAETSKTWPPILSAIDFHLRHMLKYQHFLEKPTDVNITIIFELK